jgi:hypothetical protein
MPSEFPVGRYSMRRKNNWLDDKLSLDDRVFHPVRPAFEPFPSSNKALRVVHLFGAAGASVHDSQSQRRHIAIQSRQVGQQFPIFTDHGCGVFPRMDVCSRALSLADGWHPGPGRAA